MILGFAHPAIVVPDLDKARDFYGEMFGFEVISDEGWSNAPEVDAAIGLKDSHCKGYMMAGQNCFLELFEFLNPPNSAPEPGRLSANDIGLRHLGFYVDDVHKEVARLISLGGSVEDEPIEISDGCFAVYARDPFGNMIELCQPQSRKETLDALPAIGGSQEAN